MVQMKIVTIGSGNVGGGLARLWRTAGHDVTALNSIGGDASDADVIVVAVPGPTIREALSKVTGIDGKPTIDTTNSMTGPPEGHPSLAAQVKSIVGGPTIKDQFRGPLRPDQSAARPTPQRVRLRRRGPSAGRAADRRCRIPTPVRG